jgi:hypothetical protein
MANRELKSSKYCNGWVRNFFDQRTGPTDETLQQETLDNVIRFRQLCVDKLALKCG